MLGFYRGRVGPDDQHGEDPILEFPRPLAHLQPTSKQDRRTIHGSCRNDRPIGQDDKPNLPPLFTQIQRPNRSNRPRLLFLIIKQHSLNIKPIHSLERDPRAGSLGLSSSLQQRFQKHPTPTHLPIPSITLEVTPTSNGTIRTTPSVSFKRPTNVLRNDLACVPEPT